MHPVPSRFGLYEHLARNREGILRDAVKARPDLRMPHDLKGRLGPSGSNSASPGTLRSENLEKIRSGMLNVQPPRDLGDEIRRLVKSVYGDEFDAAPTNTCEAALSIAFDTLIAPPSMGPGDPYRSRVIGLLERHAEHQLSYGRPFPPCHKDLFADRGATAGEFGILGRRRNFTDCVFVPMAGAKYEVHGIKGHVSPLLINTDAAATATAVRRMAKIHAHDLCGFVTLGYDSPGYGYQEKTSKCAPLLLREISSIATEYCVPYVCDNAWGLPFIGTDPRAIGCDVMLYSMDKVAGAPTSGLIVGREWPMVSIRRALGIHSERFGTTSAHGKGSHAFADPGKMAMLGIVAALRTLRDRPDIITEPIDSIFRIVSEEYELIQGKLPDGILITKSYNLGGVELNYERTWQDSAGERNLGIPIFTNEDRIAGSHLLSLILSKMSIIPGQADDGNIVFTPGLGTTTADGQVIDSNFRMVARGVFRALEILHDWAQQAPAQ